VTALFDQLEVSARLRRRLDNRRGAGWNERGKIRRQDGGKSVERRYLVLVRVLDFAFARLVHMGVVPMIVMMRVQVRVDERSVIVMIPIAMDVLKRRQNEGGHKRETAV
jgi:hypothetical protein